MSTGMVEVSPSAKLMTLGGDWNDGYRIDGEAFDEFVEATGEMKLDAGTLQRFVNWLYEERRLAPATVQRRLSAIRSRLTRILDSLDLPPSKRRAINDAVSKVKAPKTEDGFKFDPRSVITPEEMEALRSKCDDARALLLIEFLWATGARISEALGVELRDLSRRGRSERYHRVRLRGKGRRERWVFVSGDLVNEIKKVYRSETWLFESGRYRGNPMKRQTAWSTVSWWGAYVWGRRVHPHLFRHSWATHKLKQGKSLYAVSRYLGHADITMTAHYSHDELGPEDVLE